jgi:hypothetical protein
MLVSPQCGGDIFSHAREGHLREERENLRQELERRLQEITRD